MLLLKLFSNDVMAVRRHNYYVGSLNTFISKFLCHNLDGCVEKVINE